MASVQRPNRAVVTDGIRQVEVTDCTFSGYETAVHCTNGETLRFHNNTVDGPDQQAAAIRAVEDAIRDLPDQDRGDFIVLVREPSQAKKGTAEHGRLYSRLMNAAADHVTVLQPALPYLLMLLGIHHG